MPQQSPFPFDPTVLMGASREICACWEHCLDKIADFNSHKTKYAHLALLGSLAFRFQALITMTDKVAGLLSKETAAGLVPPPPTKEDAEEFEIVINIAKDIVASLEAVRTNPELVNLIAASFMERQKQVMSPDMKAKVEQAQDEILRQTDAPVKPRPGSNPSMN